MSDNVQPLSEETQKTETVKNKVAGKSENRGNRILYIDFLKFIGLSGIILAHVGVPDLVMMIRNFDVPLMVILSSMLAYRSYAKHVKNGSSTLSYYISRTKRLVIPTWIFLVIFFAATIILTGKHQSVKYYIASFCLTRYGIGYVWVILIYLYSALLIPLFYKLQFTAKVTAALLVIYGLYEVAYYFRLGTQIKLIDTTFYYIIPYGVLTYLGYHYCKMSQRLKYLIILASRALHLSPSESTTGSLRVHRRMSRLPSIPRDFTILATALPARLD